MTIGKVVSWASPFLLAGATWLLSQVATKGDLERHVLAHQVERQADQSVLQLFITRDSIYKLEQRAGQLRIECHQHGRSDCDRTYP